jgi:cysteine-S-conjugate beta-lyase
MKYDFETAVDRTSLSTVKQEHTPESIKEAGITSLWGAEFEFKTAPSVIEAVKKRAENGLFAYTVCGKEYFDLVCNWMYTQRNLVIDSNWIVPTYGTTLSLSTTIRAFTQKGDGVIVMTPGYHMYWESIELNERKKVVNKLKFDGDRYIIDFVNLEEFMAVPENKILVFCNPHNPVGRVWNLEELKKIAYLAAKYNVLIFSDEIFAEVIFPGNEMRTFLQVTDCKYLKCIISTSLGKSFSLTGVNHANMIIADPEVREAFIKERNIEHFGSMDPMLYAAIFGAYSSEGADWLKEMVQYVWDNYRFADSFFKKSIPQMTIIKPEGTYVLWVNCCKFGMDEEELNRFFIEKAHFGVDFGTQYGGDPGFFRMDISIPRKELEKTLCSLADAVRTTQKWFDCGGG